MTGLHVWWEVIQVAMWGVGLNFVWYCFGFVVGSWKQFLDRA